MKQSQKGFSILEVVIAASIMSAVLLATSIGVQSQLNTAGYIEDRLATVTLQQELSLMLKDTTTCLRTLQGLDVRNSRSVVIRNSDGSKFLDPTDNAANTFDRLNISNIQMDNVNIGGPNSAGTVRLSVTPRRQRKGGGPTDLKQVQVSISALVDASSQITNCSTDPMVLPAPTPAVAADPDLPGCDGPGLSLPHGGSQRDVADTCPLVRCVAGQFFPLLSSCRDLR